MAGRSILRILFRLIVVVALFVAIRYALSFAFAFWMDRRTRLSPERCFELAFRQRPPAAVTDLQGIGNGYQDFTCCFRFHTPPAEVAQFLESIRLSEWTSTDWNTASIYFNLQLTDYPKHFHPPWEPEATVAKEVYYRGASEKLYLLIDRAHGLFYVVDNAL